MDATDSTGQRAPELVRIEDEPGWAHVWATMPDGSWQPMADFHMVCQRSNCFTFTMPDGTVRHVCRDCTAEAANEREGA